MTRHLFLLGRSGSGKTELVCELLDTFKGIIKQKDNACGFFTKSVRKGTGEKCFGHNVRTIRTERIGQLSRLKDASTTLPVLNSRFTINVPMFETIVLEELQFRSSTRLVVLDELGEMQLQSQKLCKLIPRLLEHETCVFGVIPQHETVFRYEVIQYILKRDDVRFWEVSKTNRHRMKWTLRKQLEDLLM